MPGFIQTVLSDASKLTFKDYLVLGGLAALFTQPLRRKKKRVKLTGVSVSFKKSRKSKNKTSKRRS